MIDRSVLLEKIKQYDIAIVPLTKRIYGSVPSKIFEYGSLGFPILYFGGGEGETIVHENNLGWVAEVGNFDSLNAVLKDISKLKKTELNQMKKAIYVVSKTRFDLNEQIINLIQKDIF
jgi:glycosyltransferase involved in cell wall biosynthesis